MNLDRYNERINDLNRMRKVELFSVLRQRREAQGHGITFGTAKSWSKTDLVNAILDEEFDPFGKKS